VTSSSLDGRESILQDYRGFASAGSPIGSGTRQFGFGRTEPAWMSILRRLDPIVVVLALFASMLVAHVRFTFPYATLLLAAFLLCSRVLSPLDLRQTLLFGANEPLLTGRMLWQWSVVVGLLLALGFASKVTALYSRKALLIWFCVTPIALAGGHALRRRAARWINAHTSLTPRHVIIGANKVGLEIERRMQPNGFMGFFDFRSPERVADFVEEHRLVGHCRDIADFVRRNSVSAVYIALPITNAPRIGELLRNLQDTTASVYFVPDVFGFDLIQARIIDLHGMPALAICDTPLYGANAVAKRMTDLLLATLAILVAAPLMLAIAILVKMNSPGPALFRQRRYGLNGEEIVIYKFRSMTVCEDGATVVQASPGDPRITRIGRFLRRTSLDELPQLLNVIEGKMSLVGPRPHAVAHNELYRKVINGYMIRHKVRPGITGWAQVHGLRGETDKLEKMQARVHYDLDYLNNWSWALDIRILVRTVRVLLSSNNAY
jgi:putative colanic acid biosynthesis UDP-glucose lipid carrier transferase